MEVNRSDIARERRDVADRSTFDLRHDEAAANGRGIAPAALGKNGDFVRHAA